MAEIPPYLAQLRRWPPLRRIEAREPRSGRADALLSIPGTKHSWLAEVRRPLSLQAAEDVAGRLSHQRKRAPRPLLCVPYVWSDLGELLEKQDIDYVDLVGNVHVRAGDSIFLHVAGKRPASRVPTSKGIRAAGFQVLFALLVRPDLATATIRTLARAAGVSKSAAAQMTQRLREEGWLAGQGRGRKLLRPEDLIARWVEGWATIVRPRLFVGRYAVGSPDPDTLESKIFGRLGPGEDWAFGGGAAAKRLTGYFRGQGTVIHVARPLPEVKELPRALGAVPAADGVLTVFHSPTTIGLEGQQHTAHPLLVYAELLAHRDERAREAAEQIRERFLS